MIDREMFYVQISRQRDDLKIFVNGQGESKEEAYKIFLNWISKSNGEVLAHDLAKKLQGEELKEVHIQEPQKQIEKSKLEYSYWSASDVAAHYKEQELDPIRARVMHVGSERLRIGRETVPSEKWEEVIKERLTDHQYQKTNESISWARHFAEKNAASFKNTVAKGEEKGWLYRTFSSEHKEALKRAKADTKESLEKLELLEKKKENFDQYFLSPEGQERAHLFRDTFASLQKRYEQLTKEERSYNFTEKQELYRKLNALGKEEVLITVNLTSNTIKPNKNDVEKKYEELLKRQKQEKGHRHGYRYSM